MVYLTQFMDEQTIISFIKEFDNSSSSVWLDEYGRYEVVIGYGIFDPVISDGGYKPIPIVPPSQLYISESRRTIISVGGFRAHNCGKIEADKTGYSLITVPCPLSNDSFGTNRYSIGIDEQVPSLESVYPAKTVFDIKRILQIDKSKSIVGTGEFIGLFYSLLDYSLKKNIEFESLVPYVVERIGIMEDAFKGGDDASIISSIASSLVFKCLVMRVNKDHTVGCGIDHSFARCFESDLDIAHGKAVFLGSVLSSALYPEWDSYGLSTSFLIEFGNKIGITPDDYKLICYRPFSDLIGKALDIRPKRSYALQGLSKARINNALYILEDNGIYFN